MSDFRRVLNDKSVDAIVVATPDHWHAPATVWSCQAGKDVYVEKPVSHTPWEGRKMVEAARKYKRIVQVGTPTRSAPYLFGAKQFIDEGKLGKIHLCRVFNMKNWPNFSMSPDCDSPEKLDWDMWNGPAPDHAYNPTLHRRWHHFWRYSGGDIINQGIHQLDMARWLCDLKYPKAARFTQALKRTALIFSIVLPVCCLFGVMPVRLGARALYPPQVIGGELAPHPEVGRWDQALIAVLQDHGLEVLGAADPLIVAVLLIALSAAAMSTADSNLHALSTVLTRDIYDRFLRPKASQRERAWAGRITIVAASVLALGLVQVGEHNANFAPLRMIIEMQFVAMAFSCQLLPPVVDILFLRRGTRVGAIAGMTAGLLTVMLFTPALDLLLGKELQQPIAHTTTYLKSLFDIGFCGFVVNVAVFALISSFTAAAPEPCGGTGTHHACWKRRVNPRLYLPLAHFYRHSTVLEILRLTDVQSTLGSGRKNGQRGLTVTHIFC